MPEFLPILALALLPAAGNLIGTFSAEYLPVSPRANGALLHAAAGVAIAVVSIELMPRIVQNIPAWLLVLGFALGAAFTVLMVRGVRRISERQRARGARTWMLWLAVAADLLADGLMIGVGSTVSSRLGLLLGLSQIVANVPGGFATVANFRSKGVSRRARLLGALAFALPVLLGVSAGYWLLRDVPGWVRSGALAFVVGVLLLATVEDVVPQADEPGTRRWVTTVAFAAGFGFFALLSLSLG